MKLLFTLLFFVLINYCDSGRILSSGKIIPRMFSSSITNTVKAIIDSSEFNKQISSSKDAIVKFGADWCGPCRQIDPVFHAYASKYPSIEFLSVNVDKNAELSNKYKIKSLPTFIYFRKGKIIDQFSSADSDRLLQLLEKNKK